MSWELSGSQNPNGSLSYSGEICSVPLCTGVENSVFGSLFFSNSAEITWKQIFNTRNFNYLFKGVEPIAFDLVFYKKKITKALLSCRAKDVFIGEIYIWQQNIYYIHFAFCSNFGEWNSILFIYFKTSYPYLLNPCSLYIFAMQLYSVQNQSHLKALDTIIKRNAKNESPVSKH